MSHRPLMFVAPTIGAITGFFCNSFQFLPLSPARTRYNKPPESRVAIFRGERVGTEVTSVFLFRAIRMPNIFSLITPERIFGYVCRIIADPLKSPRNEDKAQITGRKF